MEALRLYTVGSAWFASHEGKKGAMVPGQLADLAVLSADYFTIPDTEIPRLESVLTLVGGKVVYATDAFAKLAPPPLPVSPDWSPVRQYGGYTSRRATHAPGTTIHRKTQALHDQMQGRSATAHRWVLGVSGVWRLGCECFAF
jgi:hypothetical protein